MNLENIKTSFDTFLDTKVGPLDIKIKAGICAATALLTIGAFFFLSYSPKSEKIQNLQAKQGRLEQEIKKVAAYAAKVETYRAEMKEVEARLYEASAVLPQQKEIPSLLTNITALAINSGLDLLSFRPGGERPKDFYAEIPFSISVKGSYHTVGYYLYQLSKLPRIVAVNNISLGGASLKEGEMLLSSTISLVTYRFLDTSDAKK